MTSKWKRGDIVRTTARLMFGKVVIPQGTTIRIQGSKIFWCEMLAYEGNAILTDRAASVLSAVGRGLGGCDVTVQIDKCYLVSKDGTPPAYTVKSHAEVRWSRRPWMRPVWQKGRRK